MEIDLTTSQSPFRWTRPTLRRARDKKQGPSKKTYYSKGEPWTTQHHGTAPKNVRTEVDAVFREDELKQLEDALKELIDEDGFKGQTIDEVHKAIRSRRLELRRERLAR